MQTVLWKNFQVEWTKDNSPTLRLKGTHPTDPTKNAESMHHSGGAASETLYIYGEAITAIFKHFPIQCLKISSVGLGLGYNEILLSILALQNSSKTAKAQQVELDSFEIDPELKESFLNWIYEKANSSSRNEIYDRIFSILKEKLQSPIELSAVKTYVQQQIESTAWRFLDELNLEKIPQNTRYHLCLFDAFSQKTTQELWDENFLNQFVETCFDKDFALLATYACTGVLTRTLKNRGFSVIKRPGFQGKRDSTWAERKKQ